MKKRHPVLAIAVIGAAIAALVYAPPACAENSVPAHGSVKVGPVPSAPAPAKPEAPQDALGRNTPRGTVLGFMFAARKGQDDLAVQYLNTPLRGDAAVVLAHQLYTVLDRRPAGEPCSPQQQSRGLPIECVESDRGASGNHPQ